MALILYNVSLNIGLRNRHLLVPRLCPVISRELEIIKNIPLQE